MVLAASLLLIYCVNTVHPTKKPECDNRAYIWQSISPLTYLVDAFTGLSSATPRHAVQDPTEYFP